MPREEFELTILRLSVACATVSTSQLSLLPYFTFNINTFHIFHSKTKSYNSVYYETSRFHFDVLIQKQFKENIGILKIPPVKFQVENTTDRVHE